MFCLCTIANSQDPETSKIEIISYYNSTKGGVDGLDQKAANYSSNRRGRWWHMTICYTIVDVASGVNAFLIHHSYKNMKRMEFMKTIASSFVQPNMQHRFEKIRLRDLRFSIRIILLLGKENHYYLTQEPDVHFVKRKTSTFCPTPKKGARPDNHVKSVCCNMSRVL